MTSLYRLDASAAQIGAALHADAGEDPWPGGYMTPGRYGPVIVRGRDGVRRLVPRLWGVPPPPAAALTGGVPVAHVRNVESPFWIGTLRHTAFRCLVPVTSFQLWSQAPDPRTGKRVAHRFSLPDAAIFAFAGIWRDSEVASFALLTCEPNRLVASVNPRTMPVILHAEDHGRWLRADWKEAQRLVAPYPSQAMTMDEAGPR
ncbi:MULTISPECIES: SOS response-associated peptidase [Sphingobium]|uniref:SOS response-associated peptidase n=1 Tax=Sphingobium TaxID=165695 RepID=UPI0015ECD284|nr:MULTISPECIES: SOS response-associated peptidase family protein [Sphingobium]MCW2362888.1 putative SOS response-associated peptidase YedK [Sphingobium sp. B10D3B]MCW2400432.1 putative SOS response-associated peptidase YedK [Sphingobium sp. B10D7B]MCW2407411.1 putative SOS response-associated peptidase YedK [Sphingobium xanthum]